MRRQGKLWCSLLRFPPCRRNYYRFHTDREWGVAANYNLALDSGALGDELCVELICKAMGKDD